MTMRERMIIALRAAAARDRRIIGLGNYRIGSVREAPPHGGEP